jgi:acyl-CoA synthetase (AMP-forming)/AMP-acid ligase II
MTAGLMGGRFRAGFVSPFMHAWAYAIHLSILRSGGTVVIPAGTSFNAEDALEMIESKRVNFLTAIGDANLRPMVDALERKKYDMQSLFGIIASGMYTSPDVKRRLFEQIPHLLLLDVFISSEISHGAFRIYTAADKELQKATFKTTDSIKVLDPETCEPVKPGETGEVARRTESLPEGYYKDKEKTNELIREINGEHWLFSGDMAMLDKDGYFHFVGRGSECINTGGEKVYPEEVEEVIKRHSKVENAGVTGVPDEKWGEAVTAIVQLKKGEKAGESEIIDFCRDRMAGYKKPKHVIFVEELPTTTIGKAWYKELRKLVEE